MRIFLIFAAIAVASPVLAQAIVVNACSDLATMPMLTAGGTHYPYIDINGVLCVAEGAEPFVYDLVAEIEK